MVQRLIDLVFAPTCSCGVVGVAPCHRCYQALRPCVPFALPGLDWVHACHRYEGVGRDLVRALKFCRQRSLVNWASHAVAEIVVAAELAEDLDVVTWVPASIAGRRSRGFDQGEVLARAVARRLQLPCVGLLARSDWGQQTGSGRAQRIERASFQIRTRQRQRLPAVLPSVLVVDDIVTTGASMIAAARALRSADTLTVHGCALARADRQRAVPLGPGRSATFENSSG